jgi:hypothetical protein
MDAAALDLRLAEVRRSAWVARERAVLMRHRARRMRRRAREVYDRACLSFALTALAEEDLGPLEEVRPSLRLVRGGPGFGPPPPGTARGRPKATRNG